MEPDTIYRLKGEPIEISFILVIGLGEWTMESGSEKWTFERTTTLNSLNEHTRRGSRFRNEWRSVNYINSYVYLGYSITYVSYYVDRLLLCRPCQQPLTEVINHFLESEPLLISIQHSTGGTLYKYINAILPLHACNLFSKSLCFLFAVACLIPLTCSNLTLLNH